MTDIAVIGASGLVGLALTEIVTDKLKNCKITLYGESSAGRKLCYFGKNYTVEKTERLAEEQPPDYAMFMASADVAKEWVPRLAQKGTVCIDNSACFRLEKDVPLVVPQINGESIGKSKIIANPNCTTIQAAIALNALKDFEPCEVTVATYQSASGAGREGLDDLAENRGYGKLKSFRHPIADNLIPQIGEILPDGATAEERKLQKELPKILGLPQLYVNAFCVRVPVTVGHGAFVNVRCKRTCEAADVLQLLEKEQNVIVWNNKEQFLYPMPSLVRNTHFVGVGRVFPDGKGGVNMFVCADNLLVGAAYNAYLILKQCLKNNQTYNKQQTNFS